MDPRWLTSPTLVLAAWPVIWVGMVHLCLVGARLQWGRWPHRWGMDDPKGLTGAAGALYDVTVVGALIGIPLAAAVALVVVVGLAAGRRWIAAGVIAATAILSWT